MLQHEQRFNIYSRWNFWHWALREKRRTRNESFHRANMKLNSNMDRWKFYHCNVMRTGERAFVTLKLHFFLKKTEAIFLYCSKFFSELDPAHTEFSQFSSLFFLFLGKVEQSYHSLNAIVCSSGSWFDRKFMRGKFHTQQSSKYLLMEFCPFYVSQFQYAWVNGHSWTGELNLEKILMKKISFFQNKIWKFFFP